MGGVGVTCSLGPLNPDLTLLPVRPLNDLNRARWSIRPPDLQVWQARRRAIIAELDRHAEDCVEGPDDEGLLRAFPPWLGTHGWNHSRTTVRVRAVRLRLSQ